MKPNPSRIDVRDIAPPERHPLIFSTFEALAPGQAMELVNDHDPRPLFHRFDAELPGQFDWTYLEEGPRTWRVSIRRREARGQAGHCCGCCCGA